MQNDIEQNNYMQVGAMQGWQCPVCSAVNSPWLYQCYCGGKTETRTTYWPQSTTWINCSQCGSISELGKSCLSCPDK